MHVGATDMSETLGEGAADVAGPLGQLRGVLIPGETLEAFAIQRRLFALTHRRVLIAATSGRLVVLTRKLLGGFDVTTIRWQDLEEVTLHVGMLSADLALRAGKATDLASLATQGSQRVDFRVRELEELRARAGGIQVSSGPPAAPAGDDAVRRLQEAKQLLEARLITDAEYEAIKAKIVS
jgi:hypothetical protein